VDPQCKWIFFIETENEFDFDQFGVNLAKETDADVSISEYQKY